MTMPGMLDMNQPIKPRRRGGRGAFLTRMFAVGIVATMLGGGLAIVQNVEAEAISQAKINAYIRSENGIPPCKWEDGSGTPGVPEKSPCYWNAKTMGDGNGWSFIAMPDGKDKGDDKDIVYLNGPLAVRR